MSFLIHIRPIDIQLIRLSYLIGFAQFLSSKILSLFRSSSQGKENISAKFKLIFSQLLYTTIYWNFLTFRKFSPKLFQTFLLRITFWELLKIIIIIIIHKNKRISHIDNNNNFCYLAWVAGLSTQQNTYVRKTKKINTFDEEHVGRRKKKRKKRKSHKLRKLASFRNISLQ